MDSISDELFWKSQERRREKRLGQPCCTQSGISWSMMEMPGKFAVVVHGEKDCLNCFHHHRGISSVQFYSTRLSDAQLTMGETEEPLAQCLRLILAKENPEFILVLGTCPVEVVGADFVTTAAQVAQETTTPIVALKTSGLKLSSQQEMLDWLYSTLVSLPAKTQPTPKVPSVHRLPLLWRRKFDVQITPSQHRHLATINLIGFPRQQIPEVQWILGYLGFQVRTYPAASGLDEWRQMKRADHSFVADLNMFPKLMSKLKEYGQPCTEIPLPYGMTQTLTCLRQICSTLEATADLENLLSYICPVLQEQLTSVRTQTTNRHLALTVRMRNSNQIQAISYYGLGVYEMFRELGFRITILIQGAKDEAVLQRYRSVLTAHHIEAPMEVFTSPFELGTHLRQGKFDLVCVADQGQETAFQANLPAVQPDHFTMGLAGAASNWRHLQRLS